MRLREKFPGKTRSRGLKGPVVAISLNSTSAEGSIILRVTLSEELLQEINIAVGDRVDIDIEKDQMTIFRVEDGGWKIIPSGVSDEHKHGMIVPVLSISTTPVKSERAQINQKRDGAVVVTVPAPVLEGLGLTGGESA